MDTLTHALSGAVLARLLTPNAHGAAAGTAAGAGGSASTASWRLGPPVPVWQAVTLGLVAGAFPDSDAVLQWVSELAYLRGHRGVTHSVVMLPLWALLLGVLAGHLFRRRESWRRYGVIAGAAIGIHIAGDWITAFGTMLLAPVSDARFALGSVFIIDLAITGLLLVALLASAALRRSRIPAAVGLLAVSGWIVLTMIGQREALAFGRATAAGMGLAADAVSVAPRPASPFNWSVYIASDEGYHVAHVNTRRTEPLDAAPDDFFLRRYSAPYQPLARAHWNVVSRFGRDDPALARAVWNDPGFAMFRWFAEFPAVDRIERGANGATCVWFCDLRFLFPGRTAAPFVTGLCRESERASWTIRSASETP